MDETMMDRFRRGLLKRARPDEGVALISVILFMILLTGLSLVLLSVILGQMGPAYVAQKSTKTVYAAQAGLQSALGVMRSAVATTPVAGVYYGDPKQLPCTFNGNVDGATAETGYTVTIKYFTVDPTGKSADWMNANDLPCAAPPIGVTGDPTFAYIESQGTGTSAEGRAAAEGNRGVAATYQFRVKNENIPGGYVYSDSRSVCMTAKTLTAGATVEFAPIAQCTTANSARQMWIYDTTYQIKLASTTTGNAAVAGGKVLCITGSETNKNATLVVCEPTNDKDRWNQLWSWNDNGQWQGQQQTIANGTSGVCLVRNGDYLQTRGCAGALSPEPSVGAGAAGESTKQIVNYKEFGRCADVTSNDRNSTYMIVYPCKQDPTGTGTKLAWNHKWYYTEVVPPAVAPVIAPTTTGQIYINDGNGVKRCLQNYTQNASKDVNFLAGCNANNERQQWTRTAASANKLDSYTFKDSYGRCLTADPAAPHVESSGRSFSVIRVATCDGSGAQKWNAPATFSDAEFEAFKELD